MLQYGERVWNITEGSDDERIAAAIASTRSFFEGLGIPTRLSAYDLGQEAVEAVLKQLETHGMTALGEHSDIDLARRRRILEVAL